MSSCPYANVLGEPGKGFHALRIGRFAALDVLGTILLALATAYYYKINFFISLTVWFVAAELAHWLFGVRTAFLDLIGTPDFCGASE